MQGRNTAGHIPAVVICGRSKGSWEPLATIIREGQELEQATDRKLLKNIPLIRAWNT